MKNPRMNYSKYYDQIKNMEPVILPDEIPKIYCDVRALMRYAKERGLQTYDLTEEERMSFCRSGQASKCS